MKQRVISFLLAISIFALLLPTAFADAPTLEQSVDTQKLFEDCRAMYLALEGQYDSVTARDSNALSIGFMQWHGNRALKLLKKICAADPQVAKNKLGTAYYNTIVQAADNSWGNYVPNATHAAAIKSLLGTSVGRSCQDEMARDEILEEAKHGWNRGVRSEAALIYYCSAENQYGIGNVKKFMNYVREALNNAYGVGLDDEIATLELFHSGVLQAAKSYSLVGNYVGARTKVYNFVTETLNLPATGDEPEPEPVPEVPFTDLDALEETEYQAVVWAYTSNPRITSGKSATSFAPFDRCTRAEVMTFLWTAQGKPEPAATENPFTDVRAGKYYYKAVLWAVENGITDGKTPTTFAPKDLCSRAEIVTFLWAAMGRPAHSKQVEAFVDVKKSAYYYDAVCWAVENGIDLGTTEITFSPKARCTRVSTVTFLYRALTGLGCLPH